MTKRMIRDKIKKGLKEIEPKISDKLEKLKPDIAKLQLLLDKGEKAFANVTTEVHYHKMSLGPGKASYIDPEVRLKDINITTRDINLERSFEHSEDRFRYSVDQNIQSIEVGVYSDDELELFRALSSEYQSYKRKLLMDPFNPVLIEETRRLREKIVETFEVDVWFLKADHPFGTP